MRVRRPTGLRRKAREGSAAVEFALVAAPFFFMMFALLEVGLIFSLASTLESAVTQTGRMVRTGEATERGLTAAQFKTEMCRRMTLFAAGCEGKAFVDVRPIARFDAVLDDPLAAGELDQATLTYDTGGPSSLMLVRVWYKHPVLTPMMQQIVGRDGGNETVLTAATTFRSEPY